MTPLDSRKITGLVSGVLLITVLFVIGNTGGRVSRSVIRPFVKLWYRLVDGEKAAVRWIDAEAVAAEERIQELEERQAELERQTYDVKALRTENEQLRRQLQLEPRQGWRMIHAEVLMRDPVLWDYGFTIDKGRMDGVETGAAVVFGSNMMGRVSRVERHQSFVDTVVSPQCRFSVVLENSADTGILHGITGTTRESAYRCEVDYLPLNIVARKSMRVLTSGLGGAVPGGIPVGEIVIVDGEEKVEFEHARSMVRVRPFASMETIRFVTVYVKK